MDREGLVEKAGNAICQERCAYMGEPPCWALDADDGGPYPWPAEACDPDCLSLARAALAVAEPAVREDERDGIAADVDCGCAGRDAVLSAESKADRWRACPRDPCAAVEAAVIRARSAP